MPDDLETLTPILVDLAEVAYQNAVEIDESQQNPSATFVDTLVLTTIDAVLGLAVCEPHYLNQLALMRRRVSAAGFADPAGVGRFVREHPLSPNDVVR